MAERRIVHFSGMVQGVGFRYTTFRAARSIASVTGYVRNLPDGRVELVVEGEPGELDSLVAEVRAQMAGYIRGVAVRNEPATGAFACFAVRH